MRRPVEGVPERAAEEVRDLERALAARGRLRVLGSRLAHELGGDPEGVPLRLAARERLHERLRRGDPLEVARAEGDAGAPAAPRGARPGFGRGHAPRFEDAAHVVRRELAEGEDEAP